MNSTYIYTNSCKLTKHYQSSKISVEAIDSTIKPNMTISVFVFTTLIDPICIPRGLQLRLILENHLRFWLRETVCLHFCWFRSLPDSTFIFPGGWSITYSAIAATIATVAIIMTSIAPISLCFMIIHTIDMIIVHGRSHEQRQKYSKNRYCSLKINVRILNLKYSWNWIRVLGIYAMYEMHLRNIVTLVKISFVIITHISIADGSNEIISEKKTSRRVARFVHGLQSKRWAIKYPR